MRPTLEELTALREQGRSLQDMELLEEARSGLLALAADEPGNARALYQAGIAHDNVGLGREAIPYYEKALQLGLAGAERERCLMGLGSTYRYWGRYDEAIETLRTGIAEFPANLPMRVFLSMALYNRGDSKESVELLIRTLLEASDDEKLRYFSRGILAYAEDLDERAEG
ncbi:tetratricopeptide repeat protein [Paenibacillus albicereus]|uniref:Tetratricopeptide repeat protein n=1 Tax=Paenibacillus albicereus TaxID=2726185 RepID=A0A6H2GVL0_9BACL|nr:tetratricopeptide repeat protein [Paenibacillus albicereus]QJC51450.1 tetratricopeptide repeat protein [Paenibacillus albicereus]